ncbi:peptidoglycan/LPS O-acetylase OafA/YrhL [Saccharothrix carnea]|uniref:Peptidoglycan/LPS O-acetylase OafA/YrhL n=1 Tax=Saccharothrix carnea TaxID=1280637 RepID=A0A2P8I5H7_SACCR|nr:acyltransferase [Saccharothrix carnea]PSL53729.1 peptidoglycan/LPS O-acetylase OafA/YrhL [Saccharothrix carnea]
MTNAPAPAPVPSSAQAIPPLPPVLLPSLTGLRFLAAFLVFGFHLHAGGLFTGTGAEGVLEVVFGQGATGVGFFFLLSGFVLTWSAREGVPARVSLRRRAAKVLPNHLVVWVAVFAGLAWLGGVSVLAGVAGLFLLQAWIPVQSIYFGVNTPAWSLSCEAAFYAAFSPLLALVDRVPRRRLRVLAVVLMGSVVLVPVLALPLPAGLEYWFVYVFPVTRALEFVLGIVLARLVRAGLWPRLRLWQAGALAAAGYVASGHLPGTFGYVAGTVVPLALLIPAAAMADITGARSPWRNRVAVFLGELSFAFYLVHQAVMRVAEGRHGVGLPTAIGISVALLVGSLVPAWLLHRLVERPAQRLLLRPRAPA